MDRVGLVQVGGRRRPTDGQEGDRGALRDRQSPVPLDLKDEQFIDLSGDPHAYRRLKEGLKRAGLDPTSFPFELGRRPYPGFAYLEMEDAAVFFGRDAQIIRGLDEVRRLARTGVTRIFVIMGASGSGKSSFLRAGFGLGSSATTLRGCRCRSCGPSARRSPASMGSPRRCNRSSAFRASRTVSVSAACRAAAPTYKISSKRPTTGLQNFLRPYATSREQAASDENATPPTILLALDQGEELFNEEGRDEANASSTC